MGENTDARLSTHRRRVLDFVWQERKGLQSQIEALNSELEHIASSEPVCVRLQQVPGVGPLISTAVVSAIGNGSKKDESSRPAVREWPLFRHLCQGH